MKAVIKSNHCKKNKPWIVAESPSRRMISPMRLSLPTRTNSYIAAPAIPSATTTGPETCITEKNAKSDQIIRVPKETNLLLPQISHLVLDRVNNIYTSF